MDEETLKRYIRKVKLKCSLDALLNQLCIILAKLTLKSLGYDRGEAIP